MNSVRDLIQLSNRGETRWDGPEVKDDTHLFPSFNLRVGVDAWDMAISSCVMRNEGAFRYEK